MKAVRMLSLALAALATGSPSPPVPVLVELFTSEGCSSCPPADEVLRRLETEQPVPGALIIALSEHVDYWDRLGWKDPFSSSAFTSRQSDYSRAFERRSIYTPELVVDGHLELVGSDFRGAVSAITQAARKEKLPVEVERSEISDAVARLRVRAAASSQPADVVLAVVEDGLRSQVSRGENRGRTLQHRAVVRWWGVVGAAPLAAEPRLSLAPDWNRANLRAVVFVQERETKRVLGAAVIALP